MKALRDADQRAESRRIPRLDPDCLEVCALIVPTAAGCRYCQAREADDGLAHSVSQEPSARSEPARSSRPYHSVVADSSGLGIAPIVQPVLAAERLRYDPELVAVVAAETETGAEAATLATVEYAGGRSS